MTASIQPTTVTRSIEANMVEPENDRVYDATFRYSTADPWAVTIDFWFAGRFQTRWVFARQLLSDGLLVQSGEGDVLIGPCPKEPDDVLIGPCPDDTEVISLVVRSPDGRAEFLIDGCALYEWLDETYDEVPAGYEDMLYDLDAELARLAR